MADFEGSDDSKPNVGVKLIRGAKGGYQWEVKAYGQADVDTAVALVKSMDVKLRAEYGTEGQAL